MNEQINSEGITEPANIRELIEQYIQRTFE